MLALPLTGSTPELYHGKYVAGGFASGEQGVWYEPSLSNGTLFQDAAGTIPVTNVEQPVGLMLDKSGRGNHAKQTTSADRPVFSARYNLLTKTEQFNDAAWAKDTGVTVTPNQETAPNGQNTADLISLVAGAKALYVNHPTGWVAKSQTTHSFYIKAGPGFSGSTIVYSVVDSTVSAHVITLTDSWQYIRLTVNATGGAFYHEWNNKNYQQPVQFYLWGASVVPADQAHLPYQRVNTATDYDADPVKFPPYLKFNGVNSWMVTPSIDFTATDKMTVFCGDSCAWDSKTRVLFGLSGVVNSTNPGVFWLTAFDGGSAARSALYLRQSLRTVALFNPDLTTLGFRTNVRAASLDISASTRAEEIKMRVNGVASTVSAYAFDASAGEGNFTANPLYIGGSGGYYFNGNLYSLIVRGATTDNAHLTHTEKYIAYKTGITL